MRASTTIAAMAVLAAIAPTRADGPVTPPTPPTPPAPTHAAAPANTIPGLTLWAWRLEGQLPRWPIVDEGQTPNAYAVVPSAAGIHDPLQAADGPLADRFVGELRGWLRVDTAGRHQFRLTGDDGARLVIDGRELLDTEHAPGFTAEDGIELAAGLHALRIPFYEDEGRFSLSLAWMPPGRVGYAAIPADNLRTEPGQTFVTSPGAKRWHFAGDDRRPGDGIPLAAPHPAFRLEKARTPDFRPQVGALCFLPDGTLALAEWQRDGKVWILPDTGATPAAPRLFAEGLSEPLGLQWVDGALVATQRGEVTRLLDTDGDGRADRYECIAAGWPQSANYHEFTFNLTPWRGRLWFTTSVPLRGGLTNYVPGTDGDFTTPDGPGSLWSIAPGGGDLRREARGFRTPNGMGRGVGGELFVCDNQGGWMPASRLDRIVPVDPTKPGALPFYGHQERRDARERMEPPVTWFPHGEIGNSPSQPVLVHDGPHRGQMYVGDVTYGGVTRVQVERVTDAAGRTHVQGAVFPMSQGIEAGVNRLAWNPDDGSLWLGGVGSNGNWNHLGHTFGLERLAPAWDRAAGPDSARGAAFELLRVEARPHGYLVTLTKPAARSALEDPAHWEIHSWHYEPTEAYGGPKCAPRSHAVAHAEASPDGRQVRLDLEGFDEAIAATRTAAPDCGTVFAIRMKGIDAADGTAPWSTNAWHTLHAVPKDERAFERWTGPTARTPGALTLFAGDAADLRHWRRAGAGTAGATNGGGSDAPTWRVEHGELLVDTPTKDIGANDIVTDRTFGDCFVHVEWLSPPGGSSKDGQRNGNSGIKLAERYEVQIMNTPPAPEPPRFNEAGSIYRQRPADTNASTGAGTWQTYDIWFTAPRWSDGPGADGKPRKTANARLTVVWNGVLVHDDAEVKDKTGMSAAEAPGAARILLQSHPSDAEGPVRYRNVWAAEGEAMPARPTKIGK